MSAPRAPDRGGRGEGGPIDRREHELADRELWLVSRSQADGARARVDGAFRERLLREELVLDAGEAPRVVAEP